MSKVLLISAVTVLVISYAFYNSITLTEYFKEIASFNDARCSKIPGFPGIEDIVKYDYYLIGGSNDHLRASIAKDLSTLSNGQMISFNLKTNQLSPLPISSFPIDIPFQPHGISLYQNRYLYVINHSFTKGERVEVFSIINSPLSLHYERSLLLPEGFNRVTNDLVVIGEDEFYFTTSNAMSRNPTDNIIRKNVFNYINFFSVLFRLRLTYVYHYKQNTTRKVALSDSILNNGIEYDKNKQLLYIAQTLDKRIRVLKVNHQTGGEAKLDRDIELQYAVDNISYDQERGVMIVGVIGKVYQTVQLSKHYAKFGNIDVEEIFGGAIEIDVSNEDKITLLVLNKNKLKAVSTGIKANGSIYLSSFADDGILVCPLNQTQ